MLKISIIIPIYNVENYLNRSLDSIKNQTYQNWECILINDGSTDKSEEICQRYVEKDRRFKLYTQKNSGSGIARSNGLNKASGDYICFIDPDDYIHTEALQNNISIAEHYEPDVIANGYNELREKSVNQRKHVITGFFKQKEFREYFKSYAQVGATAVWNKLYKHSFLKNNHVTFTSQRVGQDALFNYDVYKYVASIYIDGNCYYYYDLTREDSVVNTYNENRFKYENNILNSFKALVKYWNRENEYINEILIREWNILFNEIKNINLQNSPYSNEQKKIFLGKIYASDRFQNLTSKLSLSKIPSRISQIVFYLLNKKMYNVLLIVIRLYLNIRSYY